MATIVGVAISFVVFVALAVGCGALVLDRLDDPPAGSAATSRYLMVKIGSSRDQVLCEVGTPLDGPDAHSTEEEFGDAPQSYQCDYYEQRASNTYVGYTGVMRLCYMSNVLVRKDDLSIERPNELCSWIDKEATSPHCHTPTP
jgi:hypothetical protein